MKLQSPILAIMIGLLLHTASLIPSQVQKPDELFEDDYFARLAFEIDMPIFTGLHSIEAMRTVIERDFDENTNTLKRTVTEPTIPWDNLEDILGDYLAICDKNKQGTGLFVEKKYVAKRKILAIGDLHGSIYTLLDIFDDWIEKGWLYDDYTLASDVHAVFLGDYVDRGEGGIEALCMLLRLKIKNWSQVTIIRGNHEEWAVNEMFTFVKELARKYPRYLWALREDTQRDHSNFIPRVYNTFPVATFLAGGDTTDQKNLSYVLCTHGMVDEALAEATEEILAQEFSKSGAETLTFANTAEHQYVTSEVPWGDIQQYINPDTTIESAYRVKMQTGRYCANQAWLEENFLDLYPSVKLIIRGHQHAITDGVLFNTDVWKTLQCDLTDFHQNNRFCKPYPQGPFSVDNVQLISKTYYDVCMKKSYTFDDCWGKVITTSAAQNIDPNFKLPSVAYLFLLPGTTPKIPWDIEIMREGKATFVATAPKMPSSAAISASAPAEASASSSSATTSSARSA